MSIYRIHHDDSYLIFEISTQEVLNKLGREHPFHIDRSPVAYAEWWKTPLAISFAPVGHTTQSSIPDIAARSGRLFLSEKAYNALHDRLVKDGEFLPVTYDGGTGYIFNPLAIAENMMVLDEKSVTYDIYHNPTHFNFIESAIPSGTSIFRAAVDNYSGIFCVNTLKDFIEQKKLTGVYFQTDFANFTGESPSHNY